METFEKATQKESGDIRPDFDTALLTALREMEERKPEIRKDGKGDPKYEILHRFVHKLGSGNRFEDLYPKLNDVEKHTIVTRLENEVRDGRFPIEAVEKLRRELYGVVLDEDANEMLNYSRQLELEKKLQSL